MITNDLVKIKSLVTKVSIDVNSGLTDTKSDFYEFFRAVNFFFDCTFSYLFLVPSFNYRYYYHCGFPCTFSFPYL